jgi:diguanylate cyclase (GGDEF)-like protein
MGKNQDTTIDRPVTVDDHRTLNNAQLKKGQTAVNDALKFPTAEDFERDLTELLNGDYEEKGENITIALTDLDCFYHINGDFGREEGDRILIETGKYLKSALPEYARIYRIGGDEFSIIFNSPLEREEIFLLLNEIKNGYDVKTPDGVKQTMTIGMSTAGVDASRYPELVRKADSALYRAKISGRNKVAMAKEEKMIPKTSHFTQEQLQRLSLLAKQEGIGEAILLREALDLLLKKYDV